MLVVRKQTLGRVSCLLSTCIQVPKLDVAGSIPVSRSMFSVTCSYLPSLATLLNALKHYANVDQRPIWRALEETNASLHGWHSRRRMAAPENGRSTLQDYS